MDYKEFKSELGDVAVAKDHLERQNRESKHWDRIRENFSSKQLVDRIHFSKIEGLEFQPQSVFPNIKIETSEGIRRLFFHVGDEAEECFKAVRYRWKAFRQIYQ